MADGAPTKKAVSERRKQQSRQAQKNYRERQARRLRTLEALVESREVVQVPGSAPYSAPVTEPWPGSSLSVPLHPHTPSGLAPSLEAEATSAHSEPRSHGTNALAVSADPRDHAGVSDLLRRLVHQERQSDELRRRLAAGTLTVEEVLRAGLEALAPRGGAEQAAAAHARLPSPADSASDAVPHLRTDKILVLENRRRGRGDALADPWMNCLRIQQMSSVAAIRCNGEMLGITFAQLQDEASASPFVGRGPLRAPDARFLHLRPDLRPTAAQLAHAHHPWIDTLPLPTLRQRLIEGLAADPPLVDEGEFCDDLERDGLVCWGAAPPAAAPRGSGAPWDLRSWEAQPWFLRKWWFLLGGPDADIVRASRWWAELRGDRLDYPWP